MRGLDDTDRQILTLLLEDGRRPYSDIADRVDLSPPAVSDRVERLQEIGLVERFTVDLDRSMLHEGVPVLVEVDAVPGHGPDVRTTLEDRKEVDRVYTTADERVVFTATVPEADACTLLDGMCEYVSSYEVHLLAGAAWTPSMRDAELAPECAECGNTVTPEGEVTTLDGDRYHFCCPSCQSRFVDQYEQIKEGV